MMWGLDFLGIAKYGQLAAAELPDGWALGAFSEVFGDALPSVRRVLETGRCPRVRLHLMWKDDHRFTRADFPVIAREARRVQRLVEAFPGVDWRISGACEHTLKQTDALELARVVMQETSAIYVNTPWQQGGGALIPPGEKVRNEVHGTKAGALRRGYDFSYDGQNCVDSDQVAIVRRHAAAETFYLWASQCNGRKTTHDKTPRPERRAWPTSRYIDSWIALSRDRGGRVSLPRGWIYKSHADQHTVPPEPRAGKPVWIAPIKVPQIEMRTSNGQVVDRARYFGPFTGGGHRYYAGDWGYLIAEKARRISGSPLVEVWAGERKIGVINPAFRAGTFRD